MNGYRVDWIRGAIFEPSMASLDIPMQVNGVARKRAVKHTHPDGIQPMARANPGTAN